jgi:uncharacterized protein YkwD
MNQALTSALCKRVLVLFLFSLIGLTGAAGARIIGDVNGDRRIDLADVAASLRVVASLPVNPINLDADVNGDHQIGLAEAVYTLHFLAELRDLPGGCLNEQEAELVALINTYRGQNGLPPIEASRSLTMVGHWHVIDLETNAPVQGSCNMHSWSNAQPQHWSAVCYTADHAKAAGMWIKPFEITNGAYSSHGYENAAWSSGQISASQAFNQWKNSPGHNAVILELGMWQGKNWQAMGVGISQHYAVLWLGQPADPHEEIGLCE